jgi:hypothetical protein
VPHYLALLLIGPNPNLPPASASVAVP